jgi:hypothetical protein
LRLAPSLSLLTPSSASDSARCTSARFTSAFRSIASATSCFSASVAARQAKKSAASGSYGTEAALCSSSRSQSHASFGVCVNIGWLAAVQHRLSVSTKISGISSAWDDSCTSAGSAPTRASYQLVSRRKASTDASLSSRAQSAASAIACCS